VSEERQVPPDLLATAARVDPGNGYWLLLPACIDIGETLEKAEPDDEADDDAPVRWIARDEDEVFRRMGIVQFGIAWIWAGRMRRAFARRALMLVPSWKLALTGLAAGLLAAYARLLTLPLLCGWLWFTIYEEKYWLKRDTLMVLSADSPAISSVEAEIQRRLRAQTLQMLGPAWSAQSNY